MPNYVNKVKNDATDNTCRRCAEINVIKTKTKKQSFCVDAWENYELNYLKS